MNEKPAFVGVSQNYLAHKEAQSLSPQMGEGRAVFSVALSTLILAYSGLMSLLPILVLYAIWFPFLIHKGRFMLYPSKDIILPVFFVGYCLLSVLWSGYPKISAFNALELASMLVCTVLMARLVSISALVRGLIWGCTLVLVISLFSGRGGLDTSRGEAQYTIVGLFGSKNQLGLFAQVGLFACILYHFFVGKKKRFGFLLLSPALLICGFSLFFSRSATSVASFFVAMIVVCAGYLLNKMPRNKRGMTLFSVIFFTLLLSAAFFYFDMDSFLIEGLGRDATLTGRTYLWSEGIKVGLENPLLGGGYNAFWVQGNPLAEKYWMEFYVFNRSGFHFHSLFVQTFADLGAIGFLTVSLLLLTSCLKCFRYIVRQGADLGSLYCLGMVFMIFTRAFAEVDFLGPFGLGPFLFFSLLPLLTHHTQENVSQCGEKP